MVNGYMSGFTNFLGALGVFAMQLSLLDERQYIVPPACKRLLPVLPPPLRQKPCIACSCVP
jgi:hypothetical protein